MQVVCIYLKSIHSSSVFEVLLILLKLESGEKRKIGMTAVLPLNLVADVAIHKQCLEQKEPKLTALSFYITNNRQRLS